MAETIPTSEKASKGNEEVSCIKERRAPGGVWMPYLINKMALHRGKERASPPVLMYKGRQVLLPAFPHPLGFTGISGINKAEQLMIHTDS